jgi:hypothetical protein
MWIPYDDNDEEWEDIEEVPEQMDPAFKRDIEDITWDYVESNVEIMAYFEKKGRSNEKDYKEFAEYGAENRTARID